MMPRIAVAGVSLLTVALMGAGCSQAAVSPAAASLSVASADAEASADVPSAGPSSDATQGSSAGAVLVEFTKAVGPKRWGDEPFKVNAQASNQAKLKYSAKGPCSVRSLSGLVELKGAGDCVVTAKTTDGEAASLTIPVGPAKPKITFKDDAVRYERPFSIALKAKVSPSIPLKYSLVAAGSGDECKVSKGKLTLTGFQPTLTTDCKVRVAAAASSPNYESPKPVVATIHVDFPSWNVKATSPDPVQYDAAGNQVQVTVIEESGDALGMTAEQTGGEGNCELVSSTPEQPKAGTTKYVIVLAVTGPAAGYECAMTARALPPDYFDPGGKPEDDFTVTVVP